MSIPFSSGSLLRLYVRRAYARKGEVCLSPSHRGAFSDRKEKEYYETRFCVYPLLIGEPSPTLIETGA